MSKYTGNDNYGKPKQEYLDKLKAMSDDQLLKETKQAIWLSAYANNNPRSDYHWHADACYDEAKARSKPEVYKKAYRQTYKETVGQDPYPDEEDE